MEKLYSIRRNIDFDKAPEIEEWDLLAETEKTWRIVRDANSRWPYHRTVRKPGHTTYEEFYRSRGAAISAILNKSRVAIQRSQQTIEAATKAIERIETEPTHD